MLFVNKWCGKYRTAITFFITVLFFSVSSNAQLSKITAFMDSAVGSLHFNGVVLIAKGDSILLHKGYGYSDRHKKVPTDKNTIYNIASVTKAFTAVAVTKLAEQGKLHLSDPVSTFFRDAPSDKRNITVDHLLIHMSRFPQTYAAEGNSEAGNALKALWKVRLDSVPGAYSNGNYALLALIIEKVTGKKWEEYIRETILQPLHLTDTYFWHDKIDGKLPVAQSISKTKKRKRDYGYLGSTGIFTNATSLLTFQKLLNGNIILNDSSRSSLLGKYGKIGSAFPNSTDYFSYGMFQTEGLYNSIWFRGNEEHWGVTIGYWFPKSDISIIVLSNMQELNNKKRPHTFISAGIIKIMDNELR